MSTTTLRTPSPTRRLATPAAQQTPRREYRERDFGVGYGRSSGYASTRHYATGWNGERLFRCV